MYRASTRNHRWDGWGITADVDEPPVVNQRHSPRGQLASAQILRRKAAPTPLPLELIENILGISTIPVKLCDRELLVRKGCHQYGVLIALAA